MKIGYFATGVLQRLDFAEFAAWGAAQGFGGIDVAPARPEQVRIARQHGLDVRATTGFACEPVTRDAAERERQQALCRAAIDVAAAEGWSASAWAAAATPTPTPTRTSRSSAWPTRPWPSTPRRAA